MIAPLTVGSRQLPLRLLDIPAGTQPLVPLTLARERSGWSWLSEGKRLTLGSGVPARSCSYEQHSEIGTDSQPRRGNGVETGVFLKPLVSMTHMRR